MKFRQIPLIILIIHLFSLHESKAQNNVHLSFSGGIDIPYDTHGALDFYWVRYKLYSNPGNMFNLRLESFGEKGNAFILGFAKSHYGYYSDNGIPLNTVVQQSFSINNYLFTVGYLRNIKENLWIPKLGVIGIIGSSHQSSPIYRNVGSLVGANPRTIFGSGLYVDWRFRSEKKVGFHFILGSNYWFHSKEFENYCQLGISIRLSKSDE